MVAGDLVNTASRIQSVAEPGSGARRARRRGARPSRRSSTRTRGRSSSRARTGSTPLWQALRVVSRRRAARCKSQRPRGAVRRPRPRAAPDQGPLPRAAPRSGKAHLVSVTGIAGHRQVAARVGVLQVLRRDRRSSCTGTAAAASPTARASRTGRSRTWCGCAAGSPRTRTPATALREAPRDARRAHPRRRGAPLRRAAARAAARTRRAGGARPAGPVRGLAALLRAARRRRTRPCSSSRTCSGRTRRCSTSSSTCSSGRATTRST